MTAAVTRTWELGVDDPAVGDLLQGGPPYARPPWLRLLAEIYGLQAGYLCWDEPGGGCGAWPWLADRRGPFRAVGSPLSYLASIPYMGPVGRGWSLEAALEVLVGHFGGDPRTLVEVCFLDGLTSGDSDLLARHGFAWEERETRIVDLSVGETALWNGLAARCRPCIRQARDAGLAVQLATDPAQAPADAQAYYAMAVETYRRSRMSPPHPPELYAAWFRPAAPPTLYAFVLDQGRPVAAGLFPYGDGRMYYHDGVSLTAARAARPNNLLFWEVMRWGCAQGWEALDLVGTNVPGLRDFKASFGGAVRTYLAARRASGGWLRAGLAVARALRRGRRWVDYALSPFRP